MRPDPASLRALEGEGEGLEGLGGAEPEEFVAPLLDIDPELGRVAVADAAVGAVGGDDQVVIRPIVQVRARLPLEMEVHAQVAGPLLEDVQQPLAADADEAVA